MKKYLIKKGTVVHLCRRDTFKDSQFDTMNAERDLVYTNVDLIEERANPLFIYFKLPKNNKGYRLIAIEEESVEQK